MYTNLLAKRLITGMPQYLINKGINEWVSGPKILHFNLKNSYCMEAAIFSINLNRGHNTLLFF